MHGAGKMIFFGVFSLPTNHGGLRAPHDFELGMNRVWTMRGRAQFGEQNDHLGSIIYYCPVPRTCCSDSPHLIPLSPDMAQQVAGRLREADAIVLTFPQNKISQGWMSDDISSPDAWTRVRVPLLNVGLTESSMEWETPDQCMLE